MTYATLLQVSLGPPAGNTPTLGSKRLRASRNCGWHALARSDPANRRRIGRRSDSMPGRSSRRTCGGLEVWSVSAAEQSGQHAGRHDAPVHAIVDMHHAPVAGGAGRRASGRTRGHARRRRAVRRPAPLLVDELHRLPGEQRAVVDRPARVRPLRGGHLHRAVGLLARRGPGPAGVAGRQPRALRPPPHLAHPASVLAGADLQPARGVGDRAPARRGQADVAVRGGVRLPAAGRRRLAQPERRVLVDRRRDAAVPAVSR